MRALAALIGVLVVVLGLVAFGAGGGCPAALLPGTLLVADGKLAIREDHGFVRPIRWPMLYGVREDEGRLVVARILGPAIAGEGDRVELPGGEVGSNGPWGVCGDMEGIKE
jgi:hypothetical protein